LFFRYAAFELPTHAAQIQRVLAIPSKRFTRTLVRFLTRPEVDALLAAPDSQTWFGRRDHAFILMAVQTGLRLSEITGVKREDLVLGAGAHVRVIGKGRKERCTPLAKPTVAVLDDWLREPQKGDGPLAVSKRQRRALERSWRAVLAEQILNPSRPCLPIIERKAGYRPSASTHNGDGTAAIRCKPSRHRVMARS